MAFPNSHSVPPSLMRILGIDPGLQVTGYGMIESDGRRHTYIHSGDIRVPAQALADRLGIIFREVDALVSAHRPEALAIEQVFVARNASAALKLGHARGAAICAAVNHQLPVSEYSPRTIKQALVGTGGARKEQVQYMVRRLLSLRGDVRSDAADALAVALCHAHTCSTSSWFSVAAHGQ